MVPAKAAAAAAKAASSSSEDSSDSEQEKAPAKVKENVQIANLLLQGYVCGFMLLKM